ncbi:MAG: hypothetical protein ACIAQF_08735 [Phycisphaerales bacterium JB065]
MILTLAEVLDKVGQPSDLLLASIPFVLVALGMAATAGVKRRWRMWLCIALVLLLGLHIGFLSLLKLIDDDIARTAMNEYRSTTGREYDVDMQLAFIGSLLCMPFAAALGFMAGAFFNRSRQTITDPGG